MTKKFALNFTVEPEMVGMRLDQVAVQLFPEYSRSRLQQWIKSGDLRVDGKDAKAKDKLYGGENLTLEPISTQSEPQQAENIPLNICYEDEELIVVNKPQGLVVHPAVGNRSGTLLNGLLHYRPELADIPRAGIVHRLDKDTSGLMVVAKTLNSHLHLVEQLRVRTVTREYQALVHGLVTAGGFVDAPLGRHPVHRTKRAVVGETVADAKEAVTHYRILAKFRSHTHLQLKLETGRTHQIRVHMSHIGFPILGDPVYGGRPRLPKGASITLINGLEGFKRQALHAYRLGLEHPVSGEYIEWKADLPKDMQEMLSLLSQDDD